jgi:hypothetical protein
MSSLEHDMGGITLIVKDLKVGATAPGQESSATALSSTELATLDGLLATTAEINRAADVSTRLVAGGATLTLTVAAHDGKTVLWDTAAGTIITLPTAAGTGAIFRVVCSVTATSNSHVLKCGAAADIMYGAITTIDTDTADATLAFAAEAADAMDTITLNRSTTGLAAIGDWVEVQDVGTNKWSVRGCVRASGSVATPFTSAV